MQLNLLHRPEELTSLKDDLASRPAGGITEPLGGEGLGRRCVLTGGREGPSQRGAPSAAFSVTRRMTGDRSSEVGRESSSGVPTRRVDDQAHARSDEHASSR